MVAHALSPMKGMAEISRDLSDEQLIEEIMRWIDLLAKSDYTSFGAALGYSHEEGDPSESVRRAIANYRSPDLYPGVEAFSVTNWRKARGGNPEPRREVVWYEPNASMLAGAVTVDLPLNGKWSDLQADFVLLDRDSYSGLDLCLEEVYSWKQRAREEAD